MSFKSRLERNQNQVKVKVVLEEDVLGEEVLEEVVDYILGRSMFVVAVVKVLVLVIDSELEAENFFPLEKSNLKNPLSKYKKVMAHEDQCQ